MLPVDVPTNPPATVPAGVILVKGAWSSASDSSTPLPETGTIKSGQYQSPYFQLSYPLCSGWIQAYEGPPPSDSGYYVLAQIQSPDSRGTLQIAAQDMFFGSLPAANPVELVSYTSSHLRADSVVERPLSEVMIMGHSFVRLDYGSPAAGLHWAVLATQIRCHTVLFTFTSSDRTVIEQQITGLNHLRLPGSSDHSTPVCIKDYANNSSVLSRIDPLLTDRHYNPIPVRVIVDKKGRIKHIHFIRAFPDQARVIGEALRQWQFKPYVINGTALEVETGLLFGTAASKALISGKQEPQWVPARKHAPT